jgi:hypothetical protein
MEQGFPEEFVVAVAECIRQHRFQAHDPPARLEAKLPFGADKTEVTGAMALPAPYEVAEPLYARSLEGRISAGSGDPTPSFFQGYNKSRGAVRACFHRVWGANR